MIRRMVKTIKSGLGLAVGFAFTLIAAPVIRLSGTEDAELYPTHGEIEKSQAFAAELKEKYGHNAP